VIFKNKNIMFRMAFKVVAEAWYINPPYLRIWYVRFYEFSCDNIMLKLIDI